MEHGIFRFVRNGEVELATEAWGAPERGTILLAMGATASMMWWPDRLMEALAAGGYQIIRFDHRDTGQSTSHALGDVRYGLSDLAGDLIAILDAYGVDAAHIVGMSLGGYLAQIVALEHPQRVGSLTLIASEPVGIEYQGAGVAPEFMAHFTTIADLDWRDDAAVLHFLLRIAELSAGSAVPFDRDAATRRIARELQRTDSMESAFNHSMIGGELGPDLTAAALSLPVLVIHGSKDPVISVSAAQTTVETITGSQLLILEGRGHELLERDIPRIADAVLKLAGRAGR